MMHEPALSTLEKRQKILALEKTMLEMPQIEVPLEHYFAPGIYMRQMTLPPDAVITGKIHKTEHYCILLRGSVTVVTEEGTQELQGPHIIHAKPGAKRAIHAHEESVWVNVHHNPTNEQDLDRIDAIFVVDSFEALLGGGETSQLEWEK